jgi:hypothetical protein
LAAAKGRHFYEVEADTDDILHSGDMTLYNEAAEHSDNAAEMRRLVDEYCAGKRSSTPKIEVMVKKGTVKRRLHTGAEGKRLFRKKHFPSSESHLT